MISVCQDSSLAAMQLCSNVSSCTPQAPSERVWEANDNVCNPVCSDEHLGGGGLGGGGLQAESNKVRMMRRARQRICTCGIWQPHSTVDKMSTCQFSHSNCSISNLPWWRRRAWRWGRAAGGQSWVLTDQRYSSAKEIFRQLCTGND